MLGGEHSKEEWSLVSGSHWLIFDIRHDNVVYILLIVSGFKPDSLSNFTLLESLEAFCSLKNNTFTVNLPESVSFGLDTDYNEINWDIGLLRDIDILLHQTDYHLCLFIDS